MIKANEVKAMVEASIQKEKEELQKKINQFLDENCEQAILEAAGKKTYSVLVELPKGLDDHAVQVCTCIISNGYKAQVRFGMRNAILIMW